MRRIVVTTLTLAAGLSVMTAPAIAQVGEEVRDRPAIGARGMMGGGPGAMVRNPADALLERQETIGLTAEQVQQIEGIKARVEQENAPRLEQLRAAFGDRVARDMTAEERSELRQRRQELRPLREQLRATNRAAGEEIRGILTEAQHERLREIRRAERQELRERFRGERGGEGAWERRRGDGEKRGDVRRHRRAPRGGGL